VTCRQSDGSLIRESVFKPDRRAATRLLLRYARMPDGFAFAGAGDSALTKRQNHPCLAIRTLRRASTRNSNACREFAFARYRAPIAYPTETGGKIREYFSPRSPPPPPPPPPPSPFSFFFFSFPFDRGRSSRRTVQRCPANYSPDVIRFLRQSPVLMAGQSVGAQMTGHISRQRLL